MASLSVALLVQLFFFVNTVVCINEAWLKGPPLPAWTKVALTVGLKQRNIDRLTEIATRVSDPLSPTYSDYLSLEQITNLVAPKDETISTVTDYFTKAGASVELTKSKDFLEVIITVGQLNTLMGITMFEWQHVASSRVLHRTDTRSWMLPPSLIDHVDVITGISDFFEHPAEKKERKKLTAVLNKGGAPKSSAPDVIRLRGAQTEVVAHFVVYCPNGDRATYNKTSRSMYCAMEQATVTSFTVGIQSRNEGVRTMSFTPDEVMCSEDPNYKLPICQTHGIQITRNRRLQLSVTVTYSFPNKMPEDSETGYYLPYYTPPPFVIPETVHRLYGVPSGYHGTNKSNSQSVVAFEKQYINVDTDLYTFFRNMGLPQTTPIIHGTNNPASPGEESTLDIQYSMGTGVNVPTTFWSVSGPVRKGAYILEWAMQIANTTNAPLVTSISYGDTELGFYNNYGSWQYIHRMEAELTKMAARGLTVMGGSGDAGCSNVGEAGNDLSPTDPTCTPFRAFYPSVSPWVTSVSASFLSANSKPVCEKDIQSNPVICDEMGEVSVGIINGVYWTTGGGFSNLTFNLLPAWQKSAVEGYFKWAKTPGTGGSLPNTAFWNQKGRGYPDVSTLGLNLIDVFAGHRIPIGGTSASGPVLCGLVALWNDARLNAGKKPLGHLNPLFYHLASLQDGAFNDITVGNNADGDLQMRGSKYPSTCAEGFDTAPGWDPVSGLGSPNWPYIKDYVLTKLR